MRFQALLWAGCLIGTSSCGYQLQGTQNVLRDQEKVERIYISPLKNSTYKAGIEIQVYNSLIRRIGAQGAFRLVPSRDVADAVVEGEVQRADFAVETHDASSNLPPQSLTALGNAQVRVATLYRAWLVSSFTLVRVRPIDTDPTTNRVLWKTSFSRSKFFPGNTQLGPAGKTAALINESEFDRALVDLSDSMMSDVYESMFSLF